MTCKLAFEVHRINLRIQGHVGDDDGGGYTHREAMA
jgi:hypothetical protein